MKIPAIPIAILTLVLLSLGSLSAQQPQASPAEVKPAVAKKTTAPTQPAAQAAAQPSTATEPDPGERKFQANCSRCHTAPEQLSPRIVGTVVRHMRVRASLSAEDERDILRFLAP